MRYRAEYPNSVTMETSVVSGVFDSLQGTWKTIEALRAAQFSQDEVSVLGPESDEFLAMSGKLESRQPGRLIVIYGCIGMMLGILLALHAILTSPADGMAVTLGPLCTLLLGAILGIMSGTLTGALIHCDSTQCDIHTGRTKANDKLVISICVENAIEQRRAEAVLIEGGAAEIHLAKMKTAGQSSTGVNTFVH